MTTEKRHLAVIGMEGIARLPVPNQLGRELIQQEFALRNAGIVVMQRGLEIRIAQDQFLDELQLRHRFIVALRFIENIR